VEAALRTRPELIILGAALPRLNGVDAAAQIKTGLPGVKLLFFTESPVHLDAAFKAGATGYVLKSCTGIELLDAVKGILNNRIYVTPSVSPEQLEQFTDASRAAAAVNLTMREREILQLVAEGQATKEIAHGLAISINTVSFHRGNLRKQIGLHGTAGLTRHAIARGLACG
jgi:DNA-binding NarL/FixJ family response regulator